MSVHQKPDRSSQRDLYLDTESRGTKAAWGWIAGAFLLLIVLASAFVSYEPIQAPCRPYCAMSVTG